MTSATLAEIRCANLHLAMLCSLAREHIIPSLGLRKNPYEGDDDDSNDIPFDEGDEDDEFDDDYDLDDSDGFNVALAEQLGNRDITVEQLGQLRELYWPEQTSDDEFIEQALHPEWDGEDEIFTITKLDGLEHCVALELLDLGRLDVKGLAPIAKLTTLRRLALDFRDRVPKLSPIAKLPALEQLSLTWVADLSPLVGMPRLEQLSVAQSKVTELAPLLELPALRRVHMWWSLQPAEIERVRANNGEVLQALEQRGIELELAWPAPRKKKSSSKRKR